MNAANRGQTLVACILRLARPRADAKRSTTWSAGLIALIATLSFAYGSYLNSRAHADPRVAVPGQRAAAIAQESIDLKEDALATGFADDREANNLGLRYTVEVHSHGEKPGAPLVLEPPMRSIELNGSLSMTANST
jgi:hypothetical protein